MDSIHIIHFRKLLLDLETCWDIIQLVEKYNTIEIDNVIRDWELFRKNKDQNQEDK